MSFAIQPGQDGSVRITGRLDAAESEKAGAALASLQGPLTLDCSDLSYISSAGLSVILVTFKRLHAQGQTLRLVNLQPNVRNVFTYAGLHRLLQIE
jgi:anti-sigma B factor antagonist